MPIDGAERRDLSQHRVVRAIYDMTYHLNVFDISLDLHDIFFFL